jgi:hypothetical protein
MIPSKWSDITIKQFYNLREAMSMDWTDDTERVVAYLSALTNKPMTYFTDEISVLELRKAIGKIQFLTRPKPEIKIRPTYKIGKKRFAVDLVLRDSAASQFIDLSTLAKEKENVKYEDVLAVFFYETNWLGFRKKRTLNSQKEIAEYLLNNCTMDVVFAYSSFFLRSYQRLLKGTQGFLELKTKKAKKMLQKVLDHPL